MIIMHTITKLFTPSPTPTIYSALAFYISICMDADSTMCLTKMAENGDDPLTSVSFIFNYLFFCFLLAMQLCCIHLNIY